MTNGDILVRSADPGSGTYCFFRIQSGERSGSGLTLVTELFDGKGGSIARHEKAAPALNADAPIELSSQLPQGQYELVLTLLRGDRQLAKTRRTFFLVNRPVSIQGVFSYPLVIFPSRTALLIADIDSPPGLDPYLKWTQGRRVLARGRLRDGYAQILWKSPDEDGVYSVGVEVFSFPPAAGDDYPFASPARAAAELYISAKDREKAPARPASLKYNLFDVYISALRGRERAPYGFAEGGSFAPPSPLRPPVPVILGDDIGMKFDGQSGFACPEIIFPVGAKSGDAFTLSLGIKFDGETAGRRLMSAAAKDRSLELDLFFNENGELMLGWKTKAGESLFPSGIVKPPTGMRLLIEASVQPAGGRVRVSWKLNGGAAAQADKSILMDSGQSEGVTVIGGENSVRCSIDTLDVVVQ